MAHPEKANYLVTPIDSHQEQQSYDQAHSSVNHPPSSDQPTPTARTTTQTSFPPEYNVYQPMPEARDIVYPMPYQQQQQQQQQPTYPSPPAPLPVHTAVPPIRLALLNPRKLSSGFSITQPSTLAQLASNPIDSATWTRFITEVNDTLHKAPGTLAKGVTNFWLVSLVTLGMSSHFREMYRSRVEAKAVDVLERYNQTVFASWGIRATFDIVPVGGQQMGYSQMEYMRRDRDNRRANQYEDDTQALELVISRV
ncbi:hypothetical protein J3B02_002451 [Coemansia erecta]|nr:hypothetical protein J3B02_002451 [Coemansia erecta]